MNEQHMLEQGTAWGFAGLRDTVATGAGMVAVWGMGNLHEGLLAAFTHEHAPDYTADKLSNTLVAVVGTACLFEVTRLFQVALEDFRQTRNPPTN
jgi:hypothetical protein